MENNSGQVVLVKDINPGTNNYGYDSSFPSYFTEYNGQLYFGANDGETGENLWVSDGTTDGTQLVADIRPEADGDRNSYVSNLIEFNNKLYFTANNGVNGTEIWISDGTVSGSRLLVDINPGNSGSNPEDFTQVNDKLYFSANDGENGTELWVTDGTADGTRPVVDIFPGINDFYQSPNSSNPSNFIEFNNKLYFTADDGENGEELWVSDGTVEGTNLVEDINPEPDGYSYGSGIEYLTEFNDKLYFGADDGVNGKELWVTDGTTNGTQLVADINPSIYDGDYSSYPNSSDPSNFIEFNNKLYFTADDGVNGEELWVTDGTTNGTQLVADIRSGNDNYGYNYGSRIEYFTVFNDKLYFAANDGVNGKELWVSDGTTAGTQLLVDIYTNADYYYYPAPSDLTVFNNKLYFTVDDGVNGRELWVTDGTSSSTQLVADIRPDGVGNYGYGFSSSPSQLTVFNNELFFAARNGEIGDELFKLTFDNSYQPQQPVPTNAIDGTKGKDNLVGSDGADIINGFNGKDTIDGGAGNDELFGDNGKDYLVGGAGDDTLAGGNGKDTLDGGIGSDILTGGRGKDTFIIASGNGEDTITDFEQGKDSLGLVDLEFHDLSFSGNTIYTGDELLANLTNVNTESLSEDNFTLM